MRRVRRLVTAVAAPGAGRRSAALLALRPCPAPSRGHALDRARPRPADRRASPAASSPLSPATAGALRGAARPRRRARHTALPPRTGGPQCGYRHAVRFTPRRRAADRLSPVRSRRQLRGRGRPGLVGMARRPARRAPPFRPARSPPSTISEAIAAAASTAATQAPGASTPRANAVDIAGFRLADGDADQRRLATGATTGAKGRFLREVRDGACDLFATVLSPDYNAAHRDHFHLDQAARGRGAGGLPMMTLVTPTGIEPVFSP